MTEKQLEVKLVGMLGSWRAVADVARTTVHKDNGDPSVEPSSLWRYRMILAEHSPIRMIQFRIKLLNVKSWVSVHLVRHKFGIEHWVRTQRSDRAGGNRDEATQGTLIEHEFLANAQAIIAISRKRLCGLASPETRELWEEVVLMISTVCPELANACVPDCVYRGWCYEMKPCGFYASSEFVKRLNKYRTWDGVHINSLKKD